MEKYKTIVQIEKIKKCLESGECKEALEIAEKIDKKKLKNLSDIGIVAESYFQNQQYDTAKELFLRIYDKSRSRRVVAQLVHLSIRLQDIMEAEQYLEEFIEIAPLDFYQYIFRYSIDKLKKMPLVKLIEDLEELKKEEYIESWAYELAKLYHKAGLKDKCIAECNDIILWFGEGAYVDRAKALRAYYLGELDASFFIQKTDEETKDTTIKESKPQEAKEKETNAEETETEEDDATLESMESEPNEKDLDTESVMEDSSLLEDDKDSRITSSETNMEDEISIALSQVIDQIFNENSIESDCEVETQSKEEKELQPIETQSEADMETQPIKTQSKEHMETQPIVTQSEEKEPQPVGTQGKNEIDLQALESKENLNEEQSENTMEEVVSESMEQSTVPMESKLQKKIQLKVLTNQQLLGEEAEELLPYLDEKQINIAHIFGNFVRMEAVQKQLIRSIDQALTQKSNNINIILTGEEKSGKTTLSKCIAKMLYRMNLVASTKIALIDGEKLNSIPLLSKKEQLSDCVMVIEHAGNMTKETIKAMLKLNQELRGHVIIILEDTRENMNRLLRDNSSMNSVFNNRIHLPKYTLEDYMGFAYDYITGKDYEIEMEAFIALQNEFSVLMNKKRENTLTAIFSCLDHIMQKAEKRSTVNLKTMTETGLFDCAELMVIKKEDL